MAACHLQGIRDKMCQCDKITITFPTRQHISIVNVAPHMQMNATWTSLIQGRNDRADRSLMQFPSPRREHTIVVHRRTMEKISSQAILVISRNISCIILCMKRSLPHIAYITTSSRFNPRPPAPSRFKIVPNQYSSLWQAIQTHYTASSGF